MPRNASREECSVHAPTDECGEERRNSDHGHEVISQTKSFDEADVPLIKEVHRHSPVGENFKDIHFSPKVLGNACSFARGTKRDPDIKENVSLINLISPKQQEEEKFLRIDDA